MRKVIAIVTVALTLSVAGVAAADYYYIDTDTIEPCTSWGQATLANGQRAYVCNSWPYRRVEVPDAWDTRDAIEDLSDRLNRLETEVARLRADNEQLRAQLNR